VSGLARGTMCCIGQASNPRGARKPAVERVLETRNERIGKGYRESEPFYPQCLQELNPKAVIIFGLEFAYRAERIIRDTLGRRFAFELQMLRRKNQLCAAQ